MTDLFEKSMETLELPRVLSLLADQAVTEEGKERARRLRPETDPAEVALRRDGGAWEKVQELSGGDQRRCTLPIYPRRCDRMEIRLTGVGHARLVNWSKYVGYGSEH